MDTRDLQLKRLLAWNRFWLAVIVVFFLCGMVLNFFRTFIEDIQSVKASWHGDTLRISSWVDGPVVVTHLVKYADTETEKSTAVLPEPIAVVDSKGAFIKPPEWRRLVWRSAITGETVPPPSVGSPIKALYFRALSTKWRGADAN